MKKIISKTWLYIIVAIVTLPLNSCKKWRNGVLEIQIIEAFITGGFYTTYLTVTVDEKYNSGYPVGSEFDMKGTGLKKITGFYYPYKSSKTLGYTSNMGKPSYLGDSYIRDSKAVVFKVSAGSKYSGKNGHWPSASYSPKSKSSSSSTKSSNNSSSTPQTGTSVLLETGLTGGKKDRQYVSFVLPTGVKSMEIKTSENATYTYNLSDLFVKKGSNPTTTDDPIVDGYNADCASLSQNRGDDVCNFSSPAAGTWYIMLYNWSGSRYSSSITVTVTK